MAARVIFNADDYGITEGVSRGIRYAHMQSLVTSTSCMMNMPVAASQVSLALDECPDLGIGVHLNLTAGHPLLPLQEVPSLCDLTGSFHSRDHLLNRLPGINISEIRSEWLAQIQKFIQITGRKPTHLDSHHHSSYYSPELFRVMLELAQEFNCAIRLPVVDKWAFQPIDLPDSVKADIEAAIPRLLLEYNPRTPGGFFPEFYDEGASPERLLNFFSGKSFGTWEIMCHPGFCDAELMALSSYNLQREKELAIVTDPGLIENMKRNGIDLISFKDLE